MLLLCTSTKGEGGIGFVADLSVLACHFCVQGILIMHLIKLLTSCTCMIIVSRVWANRGVLCLYLYVLQCHIDSMYLII